MSSDKYTDHFRSRSRAAFSRAAPLPNADARIRHILGDFAASRWLRESLRRALDRDPCDAANDAEVLYDVLCLRASVIGQIVPHLNDREHEHDNRIEARTPAFGPVRVVRCLDQAGTKDREIDNPRIGFQLLPDIAQPPQALVHIEKTGRVIKSPS